MRHLVKGRLSKVAMGTEGGGWVLTISLRLPGPIDVSEMVELQGRRAKVSLAIHELTDEESEGIEAVKL